MLKVVLFFLYLFHFILNTRFLYVFLSLSMFLTSMVVTDNVNLYVADKRRQLSQPFGIASRNISRDFAKH